MYVWFRYLSMKNFVFAYESVICARQRLRFQCEDKVFYTSLFSNTSLYFFVLGLLQGEVCLGDLLFCSIAGADLETGGTSFSLCLGSLLAIFAEALPKVTFLDLIFKLNLHAIFSCCALFTSLPAVAHLAA